MVLVWVMEQRCGGVGSGEMWKNSSSVTTMVAAE